MKSSFLASAIRKCGGNEEKGTTLYGAFGSSGQVSPVKIYVQLHYTCHGLAFSKTQTHSYMYKFFQDYLINSYSKNSLQLFISSIIHCSFKVGQTCI